MREVEKNPQKPQASLNSQWAYFLSSSGIYVIQLNM